MSYIVERTNKEILIRLPLDTSAKEIQGLMNYFRYLELGRNIEVDQVEIDKMAHEAKSSWWEKNKDRFKGVEGFENFGQ